MNLTKSKLEVTMVTGHMVYTISVFLPKLQKVKQFPMKLGEVFIDNVSLNQLYVGTR